jgi:exopolysaccharide biosynthesis protein
MSVEVRARAPRRVRLFCVAAAVAASTASLTLGQVAVARTVPLDLGTSTLPEVRTVTALAPGVELTRIVRGDQPAPEDVIGTTPLGPWQVEVLRIDPRSATGHLAATYGPDLGGSETVSSLTASAGALAGVNASYFTFTKNPRYPGDPVGLGLYDGHLLSEPAATSTEVDVLVDSRKGTVRFGRLTWSGKVRNARTKASLGLELLNSPPRVPKGCTKLKDPRTCTRSGDVVRFDPAFASSTPAGRGAEVVLDRDGCVVRTAKTRGEELTRHQTSIQATGKQSKDLLKLARKGCLSTRLTLRDAKGKTVKRHAGLYGVAGRYRLVADGKVVVPAKKAAFFDRNPRTLVGTDKHGVVSLVTIDGRQTTSVGATLKEAAAVAVSLGLTDAVNLDGGGSTAMVAAGRLVNHPSHDAERAVGDALVYVEGPAS